MNPERLRLQTPLEVPLRGRSVRIRVGPCELVLEAVRGGHSVLWHAGRDARRHVIGLPGGGRLALVLRPPKLPIRLLLRETLTLAPGARIRGYVQVPLTPTLRFRAEDEPATSEQTLIEFTPAALAAEWDDQRGATYCCSSSWFTRYPVHGGEPRVTIPVRVRNAGRSVLSPDHLPLSLAPDDLRELRSGVATAPRRLIWSGSQWQSNAPAVGVPA